MLKEKIKNIVEVNWVNNPFNFETIESKDLYFAYVHEDFSFYQIPRLCRSFITDFIYNKITSNKFNMKNIKIIVHSNNKNANFLDDINNCMNLLNNICKLLKTTKPKILYIKNKEDIFTDKAIIVFSKLTVLYPEIISLLLLVLRLNYISKTKHDSVTDLFDYIDNLKIKTFNCTRDKPSFNKVRQFVDILEKINIRKLMNLNIKENYEKYNHNIGINQPLDSFENLITLAKEKIKENDQKLLELSEIVSRNY